jgi:hypothetical protein
MFAERSKWRAIVLTDDYFLNTLIEFAERGLKLPILVSVGGTTIQGTLIGEEEYFQRLSDLVKAKTPDVEEQAGHLREALRGWPRSNPAETEGDSGGVALLYIHLKDTHIMLSDGDFMGLSAPWRGKRSAIDGFWLGEPSSLDVSS